MSVIFVALFILPGRIFEVGVYSLIYHISYLVEG